MFIFNKNKKAVADNNPFPTKLITSESAIPVDIQGVNLVNSGEALNVNIVGGSAGGGAVTESDPVEIIDIVTGDNLRVATAKTIALPDVRKYKRYIISVFNGLDQNVRIAPWNTAPVVLEDESFGFFATSSNDPLAYSFNVPKKGANDSSLFFLNMITPKSNGGGTLKVKNSAMLFDSFYNVPGTLMMLGYKADAAPTSGSITIRLVGFKR